MTDALKQAIINAVAHKPMTRAELVKAVGASYHTVTAYLEALEQDGIISVDEQNYPYLYQLYNLGIEQRRASTLAFALPNGGEVTVRIKSNFFQNTREQSERIAAFVNCVRELEIWAKQGDEVEERTPPTSSSGE